MKIVDTKCPKCGAQLKIDQTKESVTCDFCGVQLFIEEEGLQLSPGGSEEAGYRFEKGRQKAITEQKHARNRWLIPILIVSVVEIIVIAVAVGSFQGHRQPPVKQENQTSFDQMDSNDEPTAAVDSTEDQKDADQASSEIVKDVVMSAVTEEMSSEFLRRSEEVGSAEVSDEDFDIIENLGCYRWGGDKMALIEMTNHSGQNVKVYANVVAYDAEGNAVSASDDRSVPFGDGENVILPVYFPETESIDKIACTYTYNMASTSAIEALEETHTIQNDRVIISVTNVGEDPISFPRADLLFYDGDGNLIWWDYNYFDNETGAILAPGATVTKQIEGPQGFQDVRVILSGEP
ncbi:MAG: zinc ribbon domain-containing protein [Lachnospiraceae bacterium]|nr:zinc ribbon domain-containing protein [Lachnospiraceae bacterium]